VKWNTCEQRMEQIDIRNQLYLDQGRVPGTLVKQLTALSVEEMQRIEKTLDIIGPGAELVSLSRDVANLEFDGLSIRNLANVRFIVKMDGDDKKQSHAQQVMALARPTYIKVHRKYLDTETLNAYEIPWEWDLVCGFSLSLGRNLDMHWLTPCAA